MYSRIIQISPGQSYWRAECTDSNDIRGPPLLAKFSFISHHLKQVQRALRERNECTHAPPIMPVSRELNSRALNLHKAN